MRTFSERTVPGRHARPNPQTTAEEKRLKRSKAQQLVDIDLFKMDFGQPRVIPSFASLTETIGETSWWRLSFNSRSSSA